MVLRLYEFLTRIMGLMIHRTRWEKRRRKRTILEEKLSWKGSPKRWRRFHSGSSNWMKSAQSKEFRTNPRYFSLQYVKRLCFAAAIRQHGLVRRFVRKELGEIVGWSRVIGGVNYQSWIHRRGDKRVLITAKLIKTGNDDCESMKKTEESSTT